MTRTNCCYVATLDGRSRAQYSAFLQSLVVKIILRATQKSGIVVPRSANDNSCWNSLFLVEK